MVPKAAVLCTAPMIVTLMDRQGRAHTHSIETGYYRHPWHGERVWFSCCRELDVFAQGREHLARAVMAVRRRVEREWGLAEVVDRPEAGCPEPFELDRHGVKALLNPPTVRRLPWLRRVSGATVPPNASRPDGETPESD